MNFDQLLAAAQELEIPSKLIEVWIPREKFVDAVIQDKSLSITRTDEPFYGMAIGAICKWESGFHVLSSIVVAEDQRGKGFGKAITRALIDAAHKKGIGYLALGVWAKNDAAIATYRSIGFSELEKFNSFSV